jgi:ABC-2 type transport system permease protein
MRRYLSKQNRALLAELVRTDFKLRYQGSVLGYAWSLLRPLFIFLILYIVFVNFLKIGSDIPHFPAYLLLGIVLWQFFADMTSQSLGSIVGRGDLIRKIRIPRWIIVVSSSLLAVVNLFLNLIVVAVFMFITKIDVSEAVVFFPLILGEIYLFALGLSLLLAAAFVKFRDLGYIWEVCIQAGFYVTPILYPLSMIGNEMFQKLIMINPVAQAIQDAREGLITPATVTIGELFDGGWYRLIPFMIVLFFLVVGVAYFKKESKYFAEDI